MSDNSLGIAIRKLAGTHDKDVFKLMYGQVVSVDLTNEDYPCCVVNTPGDVQVPNVALAASVGDGLLRVPTIGSTVAIFKNIHGDGAFILLYSDLDSIRLETQQGWLIAWDSNGEDSNLSNKSFGGLVTLVDPNNQDGGVLARLNKIEKDNNNLRNLLNTVMGTVINEPGNGAPSALQAALKAALAGYFSPALVETQRDDIENKNFTHGG